MDYTTLKNRTFSNYYHNSYLPGTLGGFESSTIFNYLLTLESIQENLTTEMNISEVWIDDVPTWYTTSLPNLFFIPRFVGETDQEYLDRLLLLINVGQNENTIINAVWSVVGKAIGLISKIQIIDKFITVDGADWEDDDGAPTDDYWDGVKLWRAAEDIQRTLFAVVIDFDNRGSTTDLTTADYWFEAENFTKIEDMVKLYKPPGSTFELRLNIPDDFEQQIDLFSNSHILVEQTINMVSDTDIV